MPLTTHENVRKAEPDTLVILARGTNRSTALRIDQFRTVGGIHPNEALLEQPLAPRDTEARQQAAGASIRQATRLPEFTSNEDVAEAFARMAGAIVYISIRKRYLTLGSESESGWVAYPTAPIENIYWRPRQITAFLRGREGKMIDAS